MPAPTIHPVEIGGHRPTTLSFKGHLAPGSDADRKALKDYLRCYRDAGCELITLLHDMVNAGGDDRLAVYLMLLPASVPEDIAGHRVWREMVEAKESSLLNQPWTRISDNTALYLLMRAVAVPDSRKTVGGTAFMSILQHYSITPTLLSAERYDAVYGWLDSDVLCAEFSNQAAGVVKGFLSSQENAHRENRERQSVVETCLASNPAFYNPFLLYYRTQSAFQAAARHFTQLRKALKEEGVAADVTSSCMWKAVLNRPDITAWQPSEPIDPEYIAIADSHPRIVARFAGQMPPAVDGLVMPSDRFQRLSSSVSSPFDVARNRGVIHRVLSLYQAAADPGKAFSADEVAMYVEDFGPSPKIGHAGWLKLVADAKTKGNRRLAEVVKFVMSDVRAFCRALRPVRPPQSAAITNLWPSLSNNRYGWAEVTDVEKIPPLSHANQMAVELYIPKHRGTGMVDFIPATKIVVTVRGNIPGGRATRLPKPLDIQNGTSQFRPDRTIPMPGDSSRCLHLKLQALTVSMEEDGERIFGCFASTLLPQLPAASLPRAKELFSLRAAAKAKGEVFDPAIARQLGLGEKVATLHIAPGGLRVASLAIFQRVHVDKQHPAGFAQIPFSSITRQTDDAAYNMPKMDFLSERNAGRCAGRRRVKFFAKRMQLIEHFHADSIDREYERRNQPLGAGYIPQRANESNVSMFGTYQTNFTKTYYRRVARDIADICARNGVGHVVLGGHGFVVGKSGIRHAIRKFYTLMQLGPRLVATGYLPNALAKIGVNVVSTGAKAAVVINEGWRNGVGGLCRGIAVQDVTTHTESAVIHTPVLHGKKNLLVNREKVAAGANWRDAAICYSTNAAWAILLNWQSKEFVQAVGKILAEEQQHIVALEPFSVPKSVLAV